MTRNCVSLQAQDSLTDSTCQEQTRTGRVASRVETARGGREERTEKQKVTSEVISQSQMRAAILLLLLPTACECICGSFVRNLPFTARACRQAVMNAPADSQREKVTWRARA